MALTKRQFQVLSVLDRFVKENGYCPSFDEIGKSLQLSSLATVHKHLNTLERKGFIRRDYNRSRSIEIVDRAPLQQVAKLKLSAEQAPSRVNRDVQLPLLGRIAAGRPLEAVSNNESLSLKEFVGSKKVFVLQVKGDSMIEDYICDGDFVVVERAESAEDGETVVALIDNGEATLKKFYREKGDIVRLQPANAAMQPIVVKAKDLTIQGRVIAVLRKY
jgi:repressor LexA